MTRTMLLTTVAALACALGTTAASGQGDRVVNVYNWSDYIAPGVLDDSEEWNLRTDGRTLATGR